MNQYYNIPDDVQETWRAFVTSGANLEKVFKFHVRTSHTVFLISSLATVLLSPFVHYVDLSSKMLLSNLLIFWLCLSIFGANTQ